MNIYIYHVVVSTLKKNKTGKESVKEGKKRPLQKCERKQRPKVEEGATWKSGIRIFQAKGNCKGPKAGFSNN